MRLKANEEERRMTTLDELKQKWFIDTAHTEYELSGGIGGGESA